jgi:hypothetical protein
VEANLAIPWNRGMRKSARKTMRAQAEEGKGARRLSVKKWGSSSICEEFSTKKWQDLDFFVTE